MTTIDPTQGSGGVCAVATTALSQAGSATPLLPEPLQTLAASGDPGAELAALAVTSGETQERVSQQARDAQRGVEAAADRAQVDAMRRKAQDTLEEGWVDGIGTMAAGGLDFASAGFTSPSGTPSA